MFQTMQLAIGVKIVELIWHNNELYEYFDTRYTKMAVVLTHLPLDKMATISQTTFPYAFSWMQIPIWISNKISLKYIPVPWV